MNYSVEIHITHYLLIFYLLTRPFLLCPPVMQTAQKMAHSVELETL